MDDRNDRQNYSREPTLDDLVELCRHLNEARAKYVVIGGFAMILTGFVRTTGDIDLLIDSSPENVARIKKAMLYLPDQAVKEINTHEVANYSVVRIADEIVVDLMHKACEITYDQTADSIQYYEISNTKIPFLKPELLLKTKKTLRARDVEDRYFLQRVLENQEVEQTQTAHEQPPSASFFRRLIQKAAGLSKGS